MRTIAIINQKGGCGKTTTSINLAACLARLGQKTLLVDMDPQGHCGVGLAVPEEQIERTIFDTLIQDVDGKPAKISEVVWQIASDFDLAPSNIKLSAFEQIFAGREGREDRLAKALATAGSTYQWCIVDCPPSVGLITFNALKACDEVVVPVETGYFSLHGLAKMMETLEVMKDRCGREILIRVLPTLYDTRTKLAREVLSELRAKFRDYLMESTVNFNTKLKEAASFGQPITEYDPGSRGYKDFVNLARELMGHRPVDLEPTPTETLSRPAELVQRAKQLAQLANFQFGRTNIQNMPTSAAPVAPVAETRPFIRPEPVRSEATVTPRERNGFGSGRKFCIHRLPNLLCIVIHRSCSRPGAGPGQDEDRTHHRTKNRSVLRRKTSWRSSSICRPLRRCQQGAHRRRFQQLVADVHADDHVKYPRHVDHQFAAVSGPLPLSLCG